MTNQPTTKLSIRQRAGRFLLGADEMNRFEESVDLLASAYRRGPYVQTPQMLLSALEEVDSQLIDLLLRQRGYDTILGRGVTDLQFTETDRLNVVDQTRWAFHQDSQAGRAVNAWTDFGFGQRPIIKPDDEALAEVFDEFWTAKRNAPVLNQAKLHNLSNVVVTDGEIYFIYWFGVDGTPTIRRLNTKVITRIEYEKGDPDVPLFYVESRIINREDGGHYSEVWYPDWRATDKQLDQVTLPGDAIHANELREHTRCVAQRVSYWDINGRGWPPICRALPWYQAYKEGLEDRAAVMRHAAMFPSKAKHKAGSRYTDSLKGQLDSSYVDGDYGQDRNPPAVSGSTWVENEAITRSRMSMATGALDGQKDTMLLLAQAAAGDGLPLVFRGRPDAMQNRATSNDTVIPWQEQMDRYAGIWEDAFRGMVEIVGANSQQTFTDFSTAVSVSRPALMNVTDVTQAINSLDNAGLNGTLDLDKTQQAIEALTKLILERYGLSLQEPVKTSDDDGPVVPDVEPPEPGSAEAVALTALGNWRRGSIDTETLVEHLFATVTFG